MQQSSSNQGLHPHIMYSPVLAWFINDGEQETHREQVVAFYKAADFAK